MNFETLLFSIENNIATITLNRPDEANTLNLQMAQELHEVALVCETNESIRAVLLKANGKMFSGGGQLNAFTGGEDAEIKVYMKKATTYVHDAVSRFARMKAPMVVAVDGAAAGIGMSFALMGDMTLASDKAKFTTAYTAAGLSPDGGLSYWLPRMVGERRARQLFLTNRLLSAEEAEQWGLVAEVIPSDQLLDRANALVKQLADGPTNSYGSVKKLLSTSQSETLEGQMTLEAEGIANMAVSRDGKEGISAFIAKRKPEFTG